MRRKKLLGTKERNAANGAIYLGKHVMLLAIGKVNQLYSSGLHVAGILSLTDCVC